VPERLLRSEWPVRESADGGRLRHRGRRVHDLRPVADLHVRRVYLRSRELHGLLHHGRAVRARDGSDVRHAGKRVRRLRRRSDV